MRIACHFQPADEEVDGWVDDLRKALPAAEVFAWVPGTEPADYAVVWQPAQQFFDEQSKLKAVFNAGAGVDALLSLRLPAGTAVVRLEDAGMAEQMSEYTAHAVLRYFRELDAYAAQAGSGQWKPRPPRKKSEFPVGILGLGILGKRVAQTMQLLGFPVHAWTRSPRSDASVEVYAGERDLDEFLAATRILICLLPLTAATNNIINSKTLRRLRAGAYFINVGRGAHVVDEDLLAALEDGQLAGATLDVFREEPLPRHHPFWHHPKITLTPHIAAATLREHSISQIVEKIAAIERGSRVSGVVELQHGY